LRSKMHETGFRNLRETITAAREALEQDDFEKLPRIMEMHGKIMTHLGRSGDCRDAELLPMMTRLRDEVKVVEQEIKRKSAEIRGELNVSKNKRDIARAYGK
jgi:hypothetical protein